MMAEGDALETNWLWRAMRREDQDALRPRMTFRHLPQGDVLTASGEPVDIVYLPTTADLANVIRFADGRSGMATNVGREGVSGLAAFLADEPCGWDVQVQIGGGAWALPADALRRQVDDSPRLMALLLSLTHFNQIEAAQNVVCNAVHPVTPRLARWLLTVQDRTGRATAPVTQEDVALLLSARRTTVNSAWQELRAAGAISQARGRVTVVDRRRLEGEACECYGVLAARAETFAKGGQS
jgi:CRP-like cAMP-binding protein